MHFGHTQGLRVPGHVKYSTLINTALFDIFCLLSAQYSLSHIHLKIKEKVGI